MQHATTLAVDLAGFTSLTDRLSPWGSRGTEELSRVLRGYFADVTDLVVEAGGDPVAFGGDSLSIVFDGPPGPTVRAALDAAARIQELTARVERVPTPAGALEVRVRVGVARGAVATAVARAGGRLLPVHVGPGLDLAHEAQERASVGSLAVDTSASSAYDACDDATVETTHADTVATQGDVDGLLPDALLDRLHRGRALGESHRTATVSFVRYPPVAPDAVRPFLTRVARLIDLVLASGGEVVQVSGGDKGVLAMVVHGAPVAHPDDPVRAVHAMAELRRREPLVAVGIATGPVFAAVLGSRTRLFPTHNGLAVNLAARLSQRGEPGSILVDDRTWQPASSHLRAAGRPVRGKVKGADAPVLIHRVAGWRRARSRPASEALPLLVGRSAELARVEQLLDTMATGRGGALAIQGPPGIGKTRVTQEAVERTRTRGFVPVVADVADHLPGQATRFWRHVVGGLLGLPARASRSAWLDTLVTALPDVPDRVGILGPVLGLGGAEPDRLLDPDAGQLAPELAQAVLGRVLAAGSRRTPVLLVVENADRLDEASAELLRGLAAAAAGCAAGIVVTRAPEPGALRPTDDEVELAPLDHEQTALLAEEAWRRAGGGTPPSWLADAVAARAGGNPLVARIAAESLLAGWRPGDPPPADDDVAGPVAGLVTAQVDRLPADARELLTVLAVAQRPCRPQFLVDLLPPGHTPSSVRRLAARLVAERMVVQADGDPEETYRVSHDLLGQVVHNSTSHAERDRLHRALVERLAAAGGDPVEVAGHVHPLGDPALARQWFPQAARADRDRWNLRGALEWLERLRPLVSGSERDVVELELLEVLLVAGRASEVLERAEATDQGGSDGPGRRSADRALDARRLLVLAEAAYSCGRFRRTEVVAARVMRLVDGADEARYLRAGELLTLSRCDQGDVEGALRSGRDLVARTTRGTDPAARATARAALAVALVADGQPGTAAEHYRSALLAATEAHDVVRQVHVLSDLAGCAYLTGQQQACVELLGQAREKAETIGYRWHLALSLNNEAQLRAALGDPYATACASAAVQRSLELGDLSMAADALQTWLTAKPSLAADSELWRRLVEVDLQLDRSLEAAADWAELAVVLARSGRGRAAREAAGDAERSAPGPVPDPVRRRTAFARLLAEARTPVRHAPAARDHALAGLTTLAHDPDLDEREAAEVALERWRLTRAPAARADAVTLVREAYAAEPSAVVRSWFRLLREPAPEVRDLLPPPVGIARGRTTRRDLQQAFTAVEAAVDVRASGVLASGVRSA